MRFVTLATCITGLVLTLACAGVGGGANNAYVVGSRVTFHREVIPDADPRTFEVLAHPWARDARRAYYRDLVIEGADPATFQPIDEAWAKDQRGVYRGTRRAPNVTRPFEARGSSVSVLKGADPATFEVRSKRFSADRNRLYFDTSPVESSRAGERFFADPKAWRYIADGQYATDGRGVWLTREARRPQPLQDADPDTWRHLGGAWSKDAQRAWWYVDLLSDVDADAFEVLEVDDWATDGQWVWLGNWPHPTPDAATFRPLSRRIAVDADKGYVIDPSGLREIPGADPATLALHPANRAFLRDKHRLYYGETPTDLPPDAQVRGGYAWSDRSVWYQRTRLDADAATFEVEPGGRAKDGTGRRWHRGEPQP